MDNKKRGAVGETPRNVQSNVTKEDSMITDLDISHFTDYSLQTTARTILELQQVLVASQIEVADLKSKLETQKAIEEYEAKLYSGIKKLFK